MRDPTWCWLSTYYMGPLRAGATRLVFDSEAVRGPHFISRTRVLATQYPCVVTISLNAAQIALQQSAGVDLILCHDCQDLTTMIANCPQEVPSGKAGRAVLPEQAGVRRVVHLLQGVHPGESAAAAHRREDALPCAAADQGREALQVRCRVSLCVFFWQVVIKTLGCCTQLVCRVLPEANEPRQPQANAPPPQRKCTDESKCTCRQCGETKPADMFYQVCMHTMPRLCLAD